MIETWFGGLHRKSKRLAPSLLSPFGNVLNQKSSFKNYFTSAICQKCCAGARHNNFWRFKKTDMPVKPYGKCIKGMIAIHFEHFLD